MGTIKNIGRGSKMSELYENRELSWLRFNQRVLEEAEDKRNPLCERLTFMSIYQTNLDEFFMVRVGSIHDQMLLEDDPRENKTNMTASEQLVAIRERVRELGKRKDESYHKLMKEVEKKGIHVVMYSDLDEKEKAFVQGFFQREIQPLLSPFTISKKRPFPFIKNKEICATAILETKGGKSRVGIVPCSNGMFSRLIEIPGSKGKFMLAEELILHFLPDIFSGYNIE